ncbi:MAG: zinc ABC transporter substrate-binding protein [Pseudooceanicola sp.]
MRSKILALALLPLPALADTPRIVTDFAPIQSLVWQVTEGVAEPDVILQPGASPHGYSMRPSEARMLQEADIVIWTGAAQTPWLEEAIATLASGARSLPLLDVDGTTLLPIRGAHDHDHGEDAGAPDDHADHEDHDDADHEDHAEQGHDEDHEDHAADDHDADDHDAAPGSIDPHAWLDPRNGAAWLRAIAATLAEIDPEQAELYNSNAEKAVARLERAEAEIAEQLSGAEGGYVTFHDAYQYFEARFGLESHGSLSATDATDPGPARLKALREEVAEEGITCLFSEPQFNPRRVEILARDLGLRTGTFDPIGADLAPGPDLYAQVLHGLADNLAACLGAE